MEELKSNSHARKKSYLPSSPNTLLDMPQHAPLFLKFIFNCSMHLSETMLPANGNFAQLFKRGDHDQLASPLALTLFYFSIAFNTF